MISLDAVAVVVIAVVSPCPIFVNHLSIKKRQSVIGKHEMNIFVVHAALGWDDGFNTSFCRSDDELKMTKK